MKSWGATIWHLLHMVNLRNVSEMGMESTSLRKREKIDKSDGERGAKVIGQRSYYRSHL